ncbi:PDZ domain-containing protein [Microbulbifer magnicolonia]|uniref:PDZ domain-containing protein n=1 Tax=Microbulbifer magnicolonia TaxID=3109744 RepID=UPI002B404D5E|nr:PDZ domain-containing protein [Microbulbifer sp. GG15]
MQIKQPKLIAAATVLLVLAAYGVNGAFFRNDASEQAGNHNGKSRLTRLFSGDDGSLEERIRKLETSLNEANQIQTQLLDLVDDLRQRLEQYTPEQTAEEVRTEMVNSAMPRQVESIPDRSSRRDHYNRHRDSQLQRLVDAGINPDRAEFILEKQERFQYEHTKLAYEYRHLKDKSSAEAERLREQLDTYSHPRKYFEHELNEQEFELYLEATGGRQEMRIDRVVSETPAANVGLRAGDRIISYNGERVFHMGDLRTQVYRVAPGKTVAVEVQREGSSSRETIYVPSGPLGIQG